MKLEKSVVNSILQNNLNSSKSISITKEAPTRLQCHKWRERKNKRYWGNNKWNSHTSDHCSRPFPKVFSLRKICSNIPEIYRLWSPMLPSLCSSTATQKYYFSFAQHLFSSRAKVLILQNTNYVKASEGGGEKNLLLPIYKVG